MEPLSVVEHVGFRNLITKLEPRYELPSRKTLTEKILTDLYKRTKSKLREFLDTSSAVSITTDGWTSVANESYLGVTCHFF